MIEYVVNSGCSLAEVRGDAHAVARQAAVHHRRVRR